MPCMALGCLPSQRNSRHAKQLPRHCRAGTYHGDTVPGTVALGHNPPSKKKPLYASPYLLLTLANLLWAGNWIVSRAFHAELPPVALSFWRWMVALLCLLPLALPHVRRDWPQLRAA